MRAYFNEVIKIIKEQLVANENFLCEINFDNQEYTRFNQAKIRQTGHIKHIKVTLSLIQGERCAKQTLTLTGDKAIDKSLIENDMIYLRQVISNSPEDPYLTYAKEGPSNVIESISTFNHNVMCDDMLKNCEGFDFVGIFTTNKKAIGFANSFGQMNWHEVDYFIYDWSHYLHKDKAVKGNYSGTKFSTESLIQKINQTKSQSSHMSQLPIQIKPGEYRTYLAPSALSDLLRLVSMNGFSKKAHEDKRSIFNKLYEKELALNPNVELSDSFTEGLTPQFQNQGFMRPDRINLIEKGQAVSCLTSPRTAEEYNIKSNHAPDSEWPSGLVLAAGNLSCDNVLESLGTGLYLNNLWYLNISDLNHARVTGMSRYACFWVEDGQIKAPIDVMRFDDSIYKLLGDNLIGLTDEQEWLLDTGSYETIFSRLDIKTPGALVENMKFTL